MTRAIGIGVLFLLCCPLATFGQDTCATALPVGEGATPFSTVGLATDGPTPTCGFGFNTDIFFLYTPACSGSVTVDTCATAAGGLDDTILAVYDGAGCAPVGAQIGCSDDLTGCGPVGFNSSVTFAATAGSSYLIQVGGWSGEPPGASVLTIVNAGAPCAPPPPVALNEIRIDQAGTDNAEFVEIAGIPGTDLSVYTLVVLGDGTTASGVVERANTLVGLMPVDGFYVLGDTASVAIGATVDLDIGATDLFENTDNLTFLLVEGWTGTSPSDLDTNDDGTLDLTPWTAIVDSVAIAWNADGVNPVAVHNGITGLNCLTLNSTAAELVYSSTLVGPDRYTAGSEFHPTAISICGGDWTIGNLNTTAFDTPGAANNCTTPPNDNCIGIGTAFSGFGLSLGENYIALSNAGAATLASPISSCGPSAGADVWFNFTTPAGTAPSCAGDVTYSLCGSSFDTILTVYTGTACTSLTEIACNDDFAGCGLASQVTIPAVAAATTHRIKVSGFGGATGDIVITVSHSAAPVNDVCDFPLVAVDGTNSWSNNCGTDSGLNIGLPSNNVVRRDIWYEYTATCSGLLTISTDQPTPLPAGTLTDTKLAIYAPSTTCPMSCGDLLGYDDDDGVSCGLCAVIANVPVTAGTTYTIRVGGFGTTTGIGVLNIACLPGPDECAGSTDVAEGVFAFDTTGLATNGVALDPLVCDVGPFGSEQIFNDIYYCYTATCNGDVQIDATGFDTRIAVYSDCTCPELPANVIACDDDTGSGGGFPFHAQVNFTATAGQSYLVRVGGFGAGDSGPGTLTIALPVANDECVDATPIFDGANVGSTQCSTASADPISGCTFTSANRDVWFSYLATCTGIASVDFSGSGPPPSLNWDTVAVVYDGCGGPIVGCDDDAGAGLTSLVSWAATAGVEYRIRVGGFAATTTGALAITVSCIPPLPNDVCVDALPLAGSGVFTVDLGPPPAVTDGVDLTGFCEVGAPTSGSGDGFPFGDNIIKHDVWYCYTPCVPLGQTATVSISTIGAGLDTRLAVYNDCLCPALAADLLACDDDTGTAGAAPFEALIPTITMAGGTTYLIQVGTFSEADSTAIDFPLTITCTPDCVPPTASFGATPTSDNAPATVVFTDASTGTGPLTYSWDFDGDSVEDDNTQNPVFVYTTPGNYNATLTVSNFCGTSSSVVPIQVCAPLAVAFTFTNTGLAEACASFTDGTTGDIASWDWDFGNGGSSNLQNPSTTYTSAGTYTVTLTVTGSCGRVSSSSQSLVVYAPGDCNADQSVNVADPLFLAAYLFSGGGTSGCMAACEVNGDATLNLGDVIYELYYLFASGSPPVAPAPCTACN